MKLCRMCGTETLPPENGPAHAQNRPPARRTSLPTTPRSWRTRRRHRGFPRLRKSSPVPLYYQLKQTIEQLIDSGRVAARHPGPLRAAAVRAVQHQPHHRPPGAGRPRTRRPAGPQPRPRHLRRGAAIKKPVFPLGQLHARRPRARPRARRAGAALRDRAAGAARRRRRCSSSPANRCCCSSACASPTTSRSPSRPSISPCHAARTCSTENLNDRSLYETLGRKYGIVPTRAPAAVAGRVLSRWPTPQLLEVDPGTPVLRIEQTTFDAEGRPFEHLESYFRGDKFILISRPAQR